ncbi:hypothetical protein [Teredinibacter franksiae]|uniref:hypothetical protein n=1 Tax=Teredinibacter franksiae TaxID=2761453 RepID=UPI0016267664|nr:hypothetical protein [Teredinibacter franksiae]
MTTDSAYTPPEAKLVDSTPGDIKRKGRYIVMAPEDTLPSRCFKCNDDTQNKKKVKLTYLNPWIYLTILVALLLTIILALIFQKKFKIELPLCDKHIKKRKMFIAFQWVLVALTTAGIFMGAATDNGALIGVSITLVLVIVISALFGRLAFAAKFKNGSLWISGAGKKFLNSLPQFEG